MAYVILHLLMDDDENPVGYRVLDGGGTDEPVTPIVVGPEPVLDGCPAVDDNDGVPVVTKYRRAMLR